MEEQGLYQPKQLREQTTIAITRVAQAIEAGNVVVIIGAGISIPPPTSLPGGSQIANKLKGKLSHTDLANSVINCPDDDLLAIVDMAESQSLHARQVLQKTILDSFDFTTAPWNYAHLAIALLMSEGKLHVLSMNWDTCIERAASISRSDVISCKNLAEFREAGNKPILIKLHGCATIESSILLTTAQFDETPWWITSQVESLFARNIVLFLGIGSIPRYIERTTRQLIGFSQGSTSVFVVAPRLSTEWTSIHGSTSSLESIPCTAQEFLDDILRALTRKQLSEVNQLVTDMAPSMTDFDIESISHEALDTLDQCSSHLIWLWLRRSVFPNTCAPTVLSPTFIQSILALVLLHSISPLQEIKQVGEVVYVQSKHFLIELAWARVQMNSNTLRRKKLESLKTDMQRRLLPQTSPFVIIAMGSVVGKLPSPAMPLSILDKQYKNDIMVGPDPIEDYWVPLDELMRIQDTVSLRRAVGIQNG